MATVKIHNPNHYFGNSHPTGNKSVLAYSLTTDEDGAATNATSNAPLEVNDVVVLGMLPGGMRLDDCQVIVSTALTADVTCSIGFAYPDGDSTEVPADAAYFGAGLVLSAAARLRTATAKLATLPKPALLTLTVTGADIEDACHLDVLVSGEIVGMK